MKKKVNLSTRVRKFRDTNRLHHLDKPFHLISKLWSQESITIFSQSLKVYHNSSWMLFIRLAVAETSAYQVPMIHNSLKPMRAMIKVFASRRLREPLHFENPIRWPPNMDKLRLAQHKSLSTTFESENIKKVKFYRGELFLPEGILRSESRTDKTFSKKNWITIELIISWYV